MTKTTAMISAAAAATAIGAITAMSNAGYIVTDDAGLWHANAATFERATLGDPVEVLHFEDGLTANVTHTGRVNAVFEEHDGHGAVSSEGTRAWKLAGGTTTFDFSREISSFAFDYSDLEWATLRMDFGGVESVDLNDSNARTPRSFAWEGPSVSQISITWVGNQNDGVGFDNLRVVPGVPAPASAALALAALACVPGARRRVSA